MCSDKKKKKDENIYINNNNSKILVSFIINEKAIRLKDDFTISLINNNDTLFCSSKDNFLKLPKLKKDSNYSVFFKYKNYKLFFQNFKKEELIPKQNFEWVFGIDQRPFNNELGLISYDEFINDTITKQLHYLKFNPLEDGDGIQFVKKIE